MSLTGHHNFVLTALHGFGNGMFIEGCCRWGMDKVWYMNRYTLNDTLRIWIFGHKNNHTQTLRDLDTQTTTFGHSDTWTHGHFYIKRITLGHSDT